MVVYVLFLSVVTLMIVYGT